MPDAAPANFADLWSTDREAQNQAFHALVAATDAQVAWAYSVWDEVIDNLSHRDNHNRAIAAQLLCNLAKSDPEGRLLRDFDALFAVTRDERFVTARHTMQALWKVGAAGSEQRERLMAALEVRFRDAEADRNTTLIRYDIAKCLRDVYDVTADEQVKVLALRLIESEDDLKYRRKYAAVWRGV